MKVTFDAVKDNPEIRACILRGDALLEQCGYTEHSFMHAGLVAMRAGEILTKLGYSEKEAELARIAGFIHDIGNMINRNDHAQSGAILAYNILSKMDMDLEDLTVIASAVGNHDEGTGAAVDAVSAALILADKSDVRKTRVRKSDMVLHDIHDRVNFAVKKAEIIIEKDLGEICLKMKIDTQISSVMDYFEIFLNRMLMCRKSAEFFGMKLKILANDMRLL